MKDVDGPADIQSRVEPARTLRMDVETAREVVGPKGADRIGGHGGRMWDFWKRSPVRSAKLERTVEPTLHAETFLVDRAVDPTTGTLRVDLSFPNPRKTLRPGLYGKVIAESEVVKGALLVPQRAVQELKGT